MVAIIFEDASLPDLTPEHHSQAADYFAIQLSIRDREEIISIFCKSNPDILTQVVREGVDAYEPIIRQIHNAVDLGAGMTDLENFMTDFVKLCRYAKVNKKNGNGSAPVEPPSVEDFLDLLNKHVNSSHRFLHQICKNGEELAGHYRIYLKEILKEFRISPESTPPQTPGGPTEKKQDKPPAIDAATLSKTAAGAMTQPLNDLVAALPASDRTAALKTLDAYAAYLAALHVFSDRRMKSALALDNATTLGPGAYLQRWRDLLNRTPITPETAKGPVRSGKSDSVRDGAMVDVGGEKLGERVTAAEEREVPVPPDVSEVVRLCGQGFRDLVREMGRVEDEKGGSEKDGSEKE